MQSSSPMADRFFLCRGPATSRISSLLLMASTRHRTLRSLPAACSDSPSCWSYGSTRVGRRRSRLSDVLLNMAVYGAMFSYLLQGLSFIQLRRHFPNIERPYRSPFGMIGAALTVIIALVTIGFQLTDPVYGTGVIGVALWYALSILYFAVYGRNTLVLSPEEEFAVQHRESSWHHPSNRGPRVARASQGEKAKAGVGKKR